MKSARHGLPPNVIAAIASVLARNPRVERAVLFGSRANGRPRTGSDIDLTLQGPELEHADLLAISGELDDLLLPYTMDLSLYSNLTEPALLDHIRRVGWVLFERQTNKP